MLKKLYNLRPYSWIDLFLLGFVAKFSIARDLSFMPSDIFMILGLFFLWSFFNIALEFRHGYSYRAKNSIMMLITSTIIPVLIGFYYNPLMIIFALSSMFFVILYLLKNKNKAFGNLSIALRGLIQSSYFFYALMFYINSITFLSLIIGISLFLLYSSRALVADLRDIKHNKEANKKTFVVNYGIKLSVILVEMMLIISALFLMQFFNIFVIFPLVLFCIIILFLNNGYTLHQLMIMTSSFVSVNMITVSTSNNLFFINLIYLGLFLNLVFYPLLERKSNPEYKQPNILSFILFN